MRLEGRTRFRGEPEITSLASQAVKLIQRDREVAHARSGRMIDRVGNRRGDADDPDLAKPLDAERVGVVRLVHEDDLDVVHVGVHRYVVLGNIGSDDAAEPVINERFLV